MTCPHCNEKKAPSKILDSRMTNTRNGERKRRRRECQFCGGKFTTYEYVDLYPSRHSGPPSIRKKKKPGPRGHSRHSKTSESNWLQRLMKKLEAQ